MKPAILFKHDRKALSHSLPKHKKQTDADCLPEQFDLLNTFTILLLNYLLRIMIKVAIAGCSSAVPWIARFQDGFRSYAESHGNWILFPCPPTLQGSGESAFTLRSLEGWKGDGIIIASNDPEELRYAKGLKIPVLNLGGGLPSHHGIPRIMVDHYATGRMAAEHLLDSGRTHLAFFGWKDQWYSTERCHGFEDRAAEAGASCHILLRPTGEDDRLNWPDHIAVLTRWLTSLPLPCGIFAVQDYRAKLLIDACCEAGLQVPTDIAILGMDNDETICEHSVPTLSSITRNAFKLGAEAAATMDLMIQGKPLPSTEILIQPEEVVVRKSTDSMYCTDPLIREAMDYMRKHMAESCKNEIIARHLGISKRTLETKFIEATSCSPHEILTRVRVNHAQKLMRLNPKIQTKQLVSECGFGTTTTFSSSFQRAAGITPSTYREQIRKTAEDH